jgi:trans-L-3-hydroxyproline dehydratase
MEPTEYPPMSGSNTMCIVTALLETGIVPMVEPVTQLRLDMPAGPIDVTATCTAGKVTAVTIRNVPAIALKLGAPLEIAGVGTLEVDIAYGGMIFAIVDARAAGFEVRPDEARDLAILGEKVRIAARNQHNVAHPEHPEIVGVSIVQFAGPFNGANQVSRNTCIVAPGRSDRSPTGTGTCARMAVLHARGLLKVGEGIIHESIIGSRFAGRILGETTVAGARAILPEITGRAWITGLHQYCVDPSDPWPEGYVVADTWGTSGTTKQGEYGHRD